MFIEGSLEVKLPTIWTGQYEQMKQQRWEEVEKRKSQRRKSQKRKSQKRKSQKRKS